MITEGKAKLSISQPEKITKKLPVFYNHIMELNRTYSITLLNALDKTKMQIADPLAGSGIRVIRFIKELKKGKINRIAVNDINPKFVSQFNKNLQLNNIKQKNIQIGCQDANLFLLESTGFDYIDIDPFGTPNPFLDSAIQRLARDGILAVTATDTSALCGTFPKACKRKYWAEPLRNYEMHEIGVRILIRKVQLIASQYAKALTPICSYSKDHYMRVFFRCAKGKAKTDAILNQHGMYKTGPLWLGKLADSKLISKMYKINPDPFLKALMDESKINTIGFYHLPSLAKELKLKQLKKTEYIIQKIKKAKYKVCKTHFAEQSIKTDIELKELKKII